MKFCHAVLHAWLCPLPHGGVQSGGWECEAKSSNTLAKTWFSWWPTQLLIISLTLKNRHTHHSGHSKNLRSSCVVVVQSLSHVQLFVTPWTAAHQASLSFAISQSCVHGVCDAVQPSHPVVSFSSCLQSFPTSGSFPVSRIFSSCGQSYGALAEASVLPLSIQGWFSLGLTGLIIIQMSQCLFWIRGLQVKWKRWLQCGLWHGFLRLDWHLVACLGITYNRKWCNQTIFFCPCCLPFDIRSSPSIHLATRPPTFLLDRPSSVHPSTHPSIHSAIFLSIYSFIHLPTPPSLYLHIFLSIHPSIYSPIFFMRLSIHHLPVFPPIHSFIHWPSLFLFIQPPTHPSIFHLFTHPSVCHSYTHWSISLSSLPSLYPSFYSSIYSSIHPPTYHFIFHK